MRRKETSAGTDSVCDVENQTNNAFEDYDTDHFFRNCHLPFVKPQRTIKCKSSRVLWMETPFPNMLLEYGAPSVGCGEDTMGTRVFDMYTNPDSSIVKAPPTIQTTKKSNNKRRKVSTCKSKNPPPTKAKPTLTKKKTITTQKKLAEKKCASKKKIVHKEKGKKVARVKTKTKEISPKKKMKSKLVKKNQTPPKAKKAKKKAGVLSCFTDPLKASPWSKPRRKGELLVQEVKLGESRGSAEKQSFLSYLFMDNYVEHKVSLTTNTRRVETNRRENGCTYELFCVKERKNKQDRKCFSDSNTELDFYYVMTDGGNAKGKPKKCNLKDELERWGDCASVGTRKMMSRLELCVSSCDRCRLSVDEFAPDDFEIIEDHYHDECGFIPSKFFDRLQIQNRRSSIQMRLFCGEIGWSKGLLLKVRDNIEKIQITQEMIKVPKSKRPDRYKRVVMIIAETFPSTTCLAFDTMLDPDKTHKFVDPRGKKMDKFQLEKYKKKVLVNEMIQKVWEELGVSKEEISMYHQKTKANTRNVKHVSVMGVVDPTGKLPEDHVFITGHVANNEGERVQFGHSCKKIFVARFPCLVERDTAIWPVVSEKPQDMLKEDWELLCGLDFGLIIFARPKSKGKISMPQMLSGDLDGDWYFICWEDKIINQIKQSEGLSSRMKEIMKKRRKNKKKTGKDQSLDKDQSDWFAKVQDLMVDLGTRFDHKQIVSKTFKAVEKLRDKTSIHHKDVLNTDAAYKQALDLHKHGGTVDLAKKIYETQLPKKYHKYFTNHKSTTKEVI